MIHNNCEMNIFNIFSGEFTFFRSSESREIMNGHRSRVLATKFHPTDTHLFVSGGWDDTVQVRYNIVYMSIQLISHRRFHLPNVYRDKVLGEHSSSIPKL